MTVDRISYQRVFPIGAYITERIGLEASLDENDNPETELNHLKIMVETLHSATIATLEEYRGSHVRVVEDIQVKEQPKSLVEQIASCTELKVLESYRLIAKTTTECQEAYDNKLKELKND